MTSTYYVDIIVPAPPRSVDVFPPTPPSTIDVIAPPATTIDLTTPPPPSTIDVQATTGLPGSPGPAGPTGPQGPPGPAGSGSAYFFFSQPTAASTWTIVHNLGFYPNVSVADSTNREIVPGDITYTNATTVTLTFNPAVAGSAYLS